MEFMRATTVRGHMIVALAIVTALTACSSRSVLESSTTEMPPDRSTTSSALDSPPPSTSESVTSSTTGSTSATESPGQVPLDQIKTIADQALVAMNAKDVGWEETHGQTTSYVNAIFDVDDATADLWVVVGDEIKDLFGYLGASYRQYGPDERTDVINTTAGPIETYILPSTADIPRETKLSRAVGVCGRYQVAVNTSDGPMPVALLELAVNGITCSDT